MSDGLLEGRVAVVTGAAQGLGYAIAELFAAHGARLVIGDIDGAAASAAAARLGAAERAIGIACDVTDDEQVEALVRAAVDAYGRLDVMVNNAGITRDATMRKMPLTDFELVLDVHLKGTWLGTRAAAGVMRELGAPGSIINMSSISGKVGNAGQTNYSAAKAGIVGLTKAAAKEVGFAGIRVNALQPGIIETAMTAKLSPEIRQSRLSDIPLGRFGEPEEVAKVALFLASDLSSYVTGVTIEIAGGRHI
ncbi:MAG: 3-oxoacyl-ACP reductase FabG [Microbacteriaceae bacterium]|nr:3-oxoacyl-ACP reductase FabG [Microbacteriaceae bacterium]